MQSRVQTGVSKNGCFRSHAIHVPKAVKPLAAKARYDVDVAIVGAGIIGLFTAQALLRDKLSVVLVERKQLCAGATGAGQGYIWMAHRSPETAAWDLASRSNDIWKQMVALDPTLRSQVEWQDTGSLLLATTEQEAQQLQQRQGLLAAHGLESMYLDRGSVCSLEPALATHTVQGGLLAPQDAQINGRRAAATLLTRCQSSPHFQALMDEPVEALQLGLPGACCASVETASKVIHARLATVITAGVWSGQLLTQATGHARWQQLLQPRCGHLLELQPPSGMATIKHGIMEMSYTKHYTAASPSSTTLAQPNQASPPADTRTTSQTSMPPPSLGPGLKTPTTQASVSPNSQATAEAPATSKTEPVDITFTVTSSASGLLLVGSSREFSGWDNTASPSIVAAILERASHFLPELSSCHVSNTHMGVRVGLRPYAVGGLPMIGPVPGCPGVFVAAGHEGSGLCLAPATAQLLQQYIIGSSSSSSSSSSPSNTAPAFTDLLPGNRFLAYDPTA